MSDRELDEPPTDDPSDSRVTAELRAAVAELEERPLEERAEGYAALLEQLRHRLESVEPSARAHSA